MNALPREPERGRQKARRQREPGPHQAQRDEKEAVHHAAEMTGETHPRVCECRHGEPGQQAQQEEDYAELQEARRPVCA